MRRRQHPQRCTLPLLPPPQMRRKPRAKPTTKGAEMKIQGALDRSRRRGPRGQEIRNVREIRIENEYTLGKKEKEALTKAKGKHPVLLRGAMTRGDQGRLNKAWDDFISNDTELYMTNEGPKTDGPDGSSCKGPQLLRTAWEKPWRVETELVKERDGDGQAKPTRSEGTYEGNAVTKFIKDPKYKNATAGVRRLHEQIAHHAEGAAGKGETSIEPTFITGKIEKGIENGEPCTTHQDTYENIALVIRGRKIFYVAKPSRFKSARWRGSGRENERPLARPLDTTTRDKPNDWMQADLRPGDILYLPRDWWHAVLSDPHTIMTNNWTN